MAEKIEILAEYLPNFLVENRSLYSILSIGVHSLDEGECLAHFELVKTSIELILDEKVEKYQKQKKIEEAKQRLNELNNKLTKNT
jgi:phosphopantetheine adenylyltransferase